MIEASAKYSEYYDETFIPQGSVYSYHFGDNIANRDHLQASLGACYYNPRLAKSCIRYVMKHSESDGEIKREIQALVIHRLLFTRKAMSNFICSMLCQSIFA